MRPVRLAFPLGLCGWLALLPAAGQTPAPSPAPPPAFVGDAQADPDTSVILDNADYFQEMEAGKWTGYGHVKVRYKGYTVQSDRADVDLDAKTALFTGNVRVRTPGGDTVEGGPTGTLSLDLAQDSYILSGGRTTVPPENTTVGLILPIFVYGGTVTGRPGLIDARGSRFTTCDFLPPHYEFEAKSLHIVAGKHLLAKYVTLYRRGHRIFTIPTVYLPLDDRVTRITAQFGQSVDEGYFAKFAIPYALSQSLPGFLRLDALQKKGLGTGFQQDYGDPARPRRGVGLASAYHLRDRTLGSDQLTASLSHRQTFGTVDASVQSQYQNNSYFVGNLQSRALSHEIDLTRSVGNLSTSVRANMTENDYGQGQSRTLNASFNQLFRPTEKETLETKFDFSQIASPDFFGGSAEQSRLGSTLDYTQRGPQFDYELLTNKFTQISGPASLGSYGGLERLPEFRILTDVTRQKFLRPLLPASTRFTLSLGEFHEPSSQQQMGRAEFGVNLGSIQKTLGGRHTFTFGASYDQQVYEDNTAQYSLSGQAGYRLRIGGKSEAGATYTYLRPYGYTPFQFDLVGRTNNAALSFNYRETPQFAVQISTAYDFNAAHSVPGFSARPWQNLSARALFAPADLFRLGVGLTYDLNDHRWVDFTQTLRMRASYGFALDVAARYSPLLRRYSAVNGQLDLPLIVDKREQAGYRIQALAGYDGTVRAFQYRGLALTRSWHDWEASVIYQEDRTGLQPYSTVTFNFRLKAFPAQPLFGIGRQGQSLDPGIGEVY